MYVASGKKAKQNGSNLNCPLCSAAGPHRSPPNEIAIRNEADKFGSECRRLSQPQSARPGQNNVAAHLTAVNSGVTE